MSKYLELFTDSFDESIVEKIKPENRPYVAYSTKLRKVMYTIVKKENDLPTWELYGIGPIDPEYVINEFEYKAVDLGLPSGTKWADRNIGATSIYEDGIGLQWGDSSVYGYTLIKSFTVDELINAFEILTGQKFSREELIGIMEESDNDLTTIIYDILCLGVGLPLKDIYEALGIDRKIFKTTWSLDVNDNNYIKDFIKYSYDEYKYSPYNTNVSILDDIETFDDPRIIEIFKQLQFTKYEDSTKTYTLESEDDAAYINIGLDWITPTYIDWKELMTNTTAVYVYENGESDHSNYEDSLGKLIGYKRVSKLNDNYIYFPYTAGNVKLFMTSNTAYELDGVKINHAPISTVYIEGSMGLTGEVFDSERINLYSYLNFSRFTSFFVRACKRK